MNLEQEMYDRFIKDDEFDFVGIVSYVDFQKHRFSYLKEIKKTYEREPTKEDFHTFCEMMKSGNGIENINTIAESKVKKFSEFILDAKAKEIELHYKKKIGRGKGFSSGVLQSVIGSFVFLILMGFLFFATTSYKVGVKEIVEVVFNIEISPK